MIIREIQNFQKLWQVYPLGKNMLQNTEMILIKVFLPEQC